MSWVSAVAIFFVLWWLVLFTQLSIGLRTQDDEGNVTPGTHSSAPQGSHMLRVILRTTLVTALVVGLFYALTRGLGYSFDDIPRIVPDRLAN